MRKEVTVYCHHNKMYTLVVQGRERMFFAKSTGIISFLTNCLPKHVVIFELPPEGIAFQMPESPEPKRPERGQI